MTSALAMRSARWLRPLVLRWLAALALVGAPVFVYAHALEHVEERAYAGPGEAEPPHACEQCALGLAVDVFAPPCAPFIFVAATTHPILGLQQPGSIRPVVSPFAARAPPARF